ncbi:alpha/beta hydrolase [Pseudobacillus wudalianchiensis]|uniref:Carboxylesterase n=1 Tax=Pseudobacillus wudalianchiensis TaxID=1743143 RepID=A0A1B9B762_9BACI|nr:alpha/beta fold hydrolase [Bacillus wudalianchiensis]OCA91936.1 carboxylesterase [Bacillus wudalianchiensis]
MKIVAPKPLMYQAKNRAVLLLHGFTGSTMDVKLLGRHLQKNGYTCSAPLYRGHGANPDEFIQMGPEDWWRDAVAGYAHLASEGYEEIAVAGVSLGGTFALKLASLLKVKAVVSMCAPVLERDITDLYSRVVDYATRYKRLEGKSDEQIQAEIKEFTKKPMESLKDLQQLISDTGNNLEAIAAPAFVLQGRLDHTLYKESAERIFRTIRSEPKQIRWYEESGHIITLGNERKQIYEDIRMFLDSLEWKRNREADDHNDE